MKPLHLLSPLFAAVLTAALLPSGSSFGQTATTDPVGFVTLTVAGAPDANNSGYTFLGLSLTQPVEYAGSADSVGTNSITSSTATWSQGQFDPANGPYFLEITSGTATGSIYDITLTNGSAPSSGQAVTISLGQNLPTGTAAPVNFKIRKHWTLGSVFGTATATVALQGAGSSFSADKVLIYNTSTGGYDSYYFKNTGTPQWRLSGGTISANNTVIYPGEGFLVSRLSTTPVSISLMGSVKTGATAIPIIAGPNFVGNIYATAVTLGDSGLYTGSSATGVLATNSAFSADQVLIYNPTTYGYDQYYYRANAGGWRKAGDNTTPQDSVQIPVGTSFIIQRQSGNFTWSIPQHPVSF